MNPYMQQMKQYMAQHPLSYGEGGAESLMDMFYRCYAEHNPIDSESIQSKFQRLRDMYAQEGCREADVFFLSVCSLCLEHEREAFMSGFRVGAQLEKELAEMEFGKNPALT